MSSQNRILYFEKHKRMVKNVGDDFNRQIIYTISKVCKEEMNDKNFNFRKESIFLGTKRIFIYL